MSIVKSFSKSIDKDFKTVDDLINWLIFGEDERYYQNLNQNHEDF